MNTVLWLCQDSYKNATKKTGRPQDVRSREEAFSQYRSGRNRCSGSIEARVSMGFISSSETEVLPESPQKPGVSPETVAPSSLGAAEEGPLPIYGFEWRRDGKTLLRYLLDSEVHTFAFSVAANAILSFIPFIVMLYAIANSVFHSQEMVDVIGDFIKYLLPSNQDFVVRNLVLVAPRQGVRIFSLFMILISCTGIFLPLEVALNRSWGVAKSRNYIMNQLIALGLALLMVILGMASILINASQRSIVTMLFFGHIDNAPFRFVNESWMGISTAAASILFFFSIYWILPNRKLPWQPVLRVSIVTGLLWVGAKYIFFALLPRLDLRGLYGPFSVSVGLLLWAYVSGLLLFAGAQFSAMRYNSRNYESSVRGPSRGSSGSAASQT
jgi:membrane protein